jgi:hypothetical protein
MTARVRVMHWFSKGLGCKFIQRPVRFREDLQKVWEELHERVR